MFCHFLWFQPPLTSANYPFCALAMPHPLPSLRWSTRKLVHMGPSTQNMQRILQNWMPCTFLFCKALQGKFCMSLKKRILLLYLGIFLRNELPLVKGFSHVNSDFLLGILNELSPSISLSKFYILVFVWVESVY